MCGDRDDILVQSFIEQAPACRIAPQDLQSVAFVVDEDEEGLRGARVFAEGLDDETGESIE